MPSLEQRLSATLFQLLSQVRFLIKENPKIKNVNGNLNFFLKCISNLKKYTLI